MKIIYLSLLTFLQALLLAPAAAQSGERGNASRPNLLLFIVDDMGVLDASVSFLKDAAGNPIRTDLTERYHTPNLEHLTANGLMFTQAYAASVCSPSRVSMMTGMHPVRHGVTQWTHPHTPRDNDNGYRGPLQSPEWRMAGMNETDVPLPRLLREAGYTTIHAGKAHFGCNDHFAGDPRAIGFEVNIAGHGGGGPGSYLGAKSYGAGGMWAVPGLDAYHGSSTHLTEALTLEMKKALAHAVAEERPFFAHMSHYAVHAPFEVDERFRENYPNLNGKNLAFATMVEGMDTSLGELLQQLETLGVAEETLVVFVSDNGSDGPLNQPLRGKKGTRYEGGTRIPLAVAWAKPNPENPMQQRMPVPQGTSVNELVTVWDLFPTLLEAAGADAGPEVDGISLMPYLRGEAVNDRPQTLLTHFPHGHNHSFWSSYRDGDWKIIYDYASGNWELYHLVEDPGETGNRVDEDPARALELAGTMLKELSRLGAGYPRDRSSGTPVLPNLQRLKERASTNGKTVPEISPPKVRLRGTPSTL